MKVDEAFWDIIKWHKGWTIEYATSNMLDLLLLTAASDEAQTLYFPPYTLCQMDIHSWTIQDKGIQFRSSLSGDKYEIHNYENTTRKGYDVIAFDGYLQPQEKKKKIHPCQRNNGGCDQLCILMAESSHSCQCAIGFQLNSDWKTCSSNISQEYFLLYTDPYHKQIYQTSLHDTSRTIQGVPGIRMHHPISVDYDRGKQRYFWYDNIRRQFRRSDGQSDELIREVETDSSPQRLVVDPVRGFVYYTDTGRSTISKMKVDGSGHEDLFTNVRRPFDIDLDFENEIIVWTTSNSVEKSDITKNDRIVIDKGLAQAGGVAILIGGQSVYYSDNVTGTIYSYNLTTKQRKLIYENSTSRIQGLAVTDDYIYFTSYNDIGVYRINRTSGNSLTHLGDLVFARVTDIKVIRNKVEPKYREGFNWIILVAVLGALLLLLLLLAAIFGSRAARSKKKKEENPE
ncbi:hypothetical protein LSH36_207g07037 [Paralvinella palmiformis]|uniref:EGF-like domain-containing protein n=1 Tax=Paralvinella palmiformis TaxID=53620 RepID=A0AAD9JP78_9ANNE|nr:hypothetical protein LSH36_207g07037 [Paralvinella palmiformis]